MMSVPQRGSVLSEVPARSCVLFLSLSLSLYSSLTHPPSPGSIHFILTFPVFDRSFFNLPMSSFVFSTFALPLSLSLSPPSIPLFICLLALCVCIDFAAVHAPCFSACLMEGLRWSLSQIKSKPPFPSPLLFPLNPIGFELVCVCFSVCELSVL